MDSMNTTTEYIEQLDTASFYIRRAKESKQEDIHDTIHIMVCLARAEDAMNDAEKYLKP